jgi:hypothetical protein
LDNIGSEVARIGVAFGMEVLAWSQNLTQPETPISTVGFALNTTSKRPISPGFSDFQPATASPHCTKGFWAGVMSVMPSRSSPGRSMAKNRLRLHSLQLLTLLSSRLRETRGMLSIERPHQSARVA